VKIYKLSNRTGGKSLAELGHRLPVMAYRACKSGVNAINKMDYITLSYRFAKEHAEHMAATENEDYVVLYFRAKPEDVLEAYNPDEFFYNGDPIPTKVIYTALASKWGLD